MKLEHLKEAVRDRVQWRERAMGVTKSRTRLDGTRWQDDVSRSLLINLESFFRFTLLLAQENIVLN